MLTDTDIQFNPMSVVRWRNISVIDTEVMKSSLIQCPLARLPLQKGIILPWSVSITPVVLKNADIEKRKTMGRIDAIILDAIHRQT